MDKFSIRNTKRKTFIVEEKNKDNARQLNNKCVLTSVQWDIFTNIY